MTENINFTDKDNRKLTMAIADVPMDDTEGERFQFVKNKIANGMAQSVDKDLSRKQIEKNVRLIIHKLADILPTPEQKEKLDKINSQLKNICSNETLTSLFDKLGNDFTDLVSGLYQTEVNDDKDYHINITAAIYKSIINPRSPDLENILINIEKQNYKFKNMLNDVDDMFAKLRLASLGVSLDETSFVNKNVKITHKNVSQKDPYMKIT